MSMRQLLFGYVLALALGLAGTYVIERSDHAVRGLRSVRRALCLGLLAVILLALRYWIPLFLISLVAQPALLFCFCLLHLALAEVLQKPAGLKRFLVIAMPFFLGGLAFFTFFDSRLEGRTLVATIGITLVLVMTERLLARAVVPAQTTQLRAMHSLVILMIALRAARCARALFGHPLPSLLQLPVIDSLIAYLNLLTALAFAAGVVWLGVCRQRDELKMMAETDGLTGLLNRRAFEEILIQEVRGVWQRKTELALLLIDIDRFKEVNDDRGHLAGDEVIRRVGAALREISRPADVLARFGGDEFVILLRPANALQAVTVAEQIRREIAGLSGLPREISITASIGIAVVRGTDTPLSLIGRADEALYRSKSDGRNRVSLGEVFNSGKSSEIPTSVLAL